jgi:hypothetical protein
MKRSNMNLAQNLRELMDEQALTIRDFTRMRQQV